MPKGGQNRKPTQLKVIQGNPGKRPLNPNEPKPAPVAPKMPKGLDRYGRQAWQRLAPILERLGLLTEADLESFTALCEAYSRYVHAVKRYRAVLRASDPVEALDIIRKAEVSVEKSEHHLRMLMLEFGLTPAARSRLSVEVKDEGAGVLQELWSAQG
mgnify:CR=1 FL=1